MDPQSQLPASAVTFLLTNSFCTDGEKKSSSPSPKKNTASASGSQTTTSASEPGSSAPFAGYMPKAFAGSVESRPQNASALSFPAATPLAQTTAGMTGADLENLLNEAAIFAARDSRPYIMQEDIRKAFVKVGIGAEKKSRVVSEKEKRITAYHEAGHAILFHVLPDVGPVYSVSIIPTGIGAAGYTMPLPEKDEMFNTKGRMLQDIQVSLGGRIAEELVFDDITTGASQDIKQATRVARAMVTKYGMSDELGLVSYDSDEEVFIGRDFGHTKTYGEDVAGKIDAEIKRIVDECYAKAKKIILDNRKVLDAAAELLLAKEKISREEFEALFDQPETA